MIRDYSNILNVCKEQIVSMCEDREKFEPYLRVSEDKKKRFFVRQTALTLTNMTWLLMSRLTRSIQVELDEVLPTLCGKTVTKSALSHRRSAVSPDFYKTMFYATSQSILQTPDYSARNWRGHALIAADGTGLVLPDSPDTEAVMGRYDVFGNKHNPIGARGILVEDILNNLVLGVDLARYHTDERKMLAAIIPSLAKIRSEKPPVVICDRGYFSYSLMELLDRSGLKYVIRMPDGAGTSRMIRDGNDGEASVTVRPSPYVRTMDTGRRIASLSFRVVEIEIPSADREILVTNLDIHDASVSDLKELYNLRWGVEILIDRLKNVLEIEHFSGTRLLAVEQDIFTAAITYNIASVIQRMTSQEYCARHLHKKPTMYRYKPNLSVIIGVLCFYMPRLAKGNVSDFTAWMTPMLIHAMTPVMPGRTYSRKKRHKNRQGRFYTEPAFKQTV